MARTPVSLDTQARLLAECRRRCAICFGLEHDFAVKRGQIAHLDQDNSNGSEDNLVFLCLEHHDLYDSKTSQSKGLTQAEVTRYRNHLLAEVGKRWDDGRLDRPLLQLSVREPVGGASPMRWRETGYTSLSRFYHLQVSNAHRSVPAHSVQVFLTRVDGRKSDGTFDPVWHGDAAAVWWRYQGEDPSLPRAPTIGPPADLDLCFIVKSPPDRPTAPRLSLRVAFIPVNLEPHLEIRPDAPVILHFLARGEEADSETLQVKVSWNGQWADDDAEMARNLAIEALSGSV